MGIATDPDEWTYGLNNGCWAAGKTPATLVVSVSGIMQGATWGPVWGPPPNGVYSFPQQLATWWHDADPAHPSGFRNSVPGSRVNIKGGLLNAFFSTDPANCNWYFVNEIVNPNSIFYGGHAIVTQRPPGASAPSHADILELLNMQGQPSRMADIFPLDNTYLVAMFADIIESTRIYIKYAF